MQTLGSSGSVLDNLKHLIMPMLVLALVLVAQWSRYTRSAMLEVLQQDYMRTARAKGLAQRAVLLGHGFRNARLPLVTLAGLQLPVLFGGALVTETVFSWPGMGMLAAGAIAGRDYDLVTATVVVGSVMVVVGNLVADALHMAIDPRIRE